MQTVINCDTYENTTKHLCRNCHDRLYVIVTIPKVKAFLITRWFFLTFALLTLPPECPPHVNCKWHPKFRASIGCQKCEVPVYEKCLIGEHKGHKVIEFTLLFEVKRDELKQKISAVVSELLTKVEGIKEGGRK